MLITIPEHMSSYNISNILKVVMENITKPDLANEKRLVFGVQDKP